VKNRRRTERKRTKQTNNDPQITGADPGFQVGGGEGRLKKIAPSGGRREKYWGISCEKSRFYAKKFIFFPILGAARAGCAPSLYPPLKHYTEY
jgi:hypothetical protein